jgi:hypothetical protein
VEALVLSCGSLKYNNENPKCDKCQCEESICVRELRENLRKLIGREISVFVINQLALVTGTLLKVDCGTIVINGISIDEQPPITRPILIKICDISGFVCGNFINPGQNTDCFPFGIQAEENCLGCSCPCTESNCVREIREQLQYCIGKNMNMGIFGQILEGPLLKVNCGSVLFGDFVGSGFVFFVPMCKIQYVYALADSSPCNFRSHEQKQNLKCKCECIDDICTEALKKELETCIDKQVQIFFECTNPQGIIAGTIQKVNCGTILILVEGNLVLIPLCQISAVLNLTNSPPFIPPN